MRYEKTYAARRTGVLCDGGKDKPGKSLDEGCRSSSAVNAPRPEPNHCQILPTLSKFTKSSLTPLECKDTIFPLIQYGFQYISDLLSSREVAQSYTYPEQSVSSGPPPLPSTRISNACPFSPSVLLDTASRTLRRVEEEGLATRFISLRAEGRSGRKSRY